MGTHTRCTREQACGYGVSTAAGAHRQRNAPISHVLSAHARLHSLRQLAAVVAVHAQEQEHGRQVGAEGVPARRGRAARQERRSHAVVHQARQPADRTAGGAGATHCRWNACCRRHLVMGVQSCLCRDTSALASKPGDRNMVTSVGAVSRSISMMGLWLATVSGRRSVYLWWRKEGTRWAPEQNEERVRGSQAEARLGL